MYCKNCGNEIADGSKFCNHCGSPVTAAAPQQHDDPAAAVSATAKPQAAASVAPAAASVPTPGAEKKQETKTDDTPREPLFDEFKWNVEEYPGRSPAKTEDVDFDWNADPSDIPDTVPATARRSVTAASDADRTVQDVAAEAPGLGLSSSAGDTAQGAHAVTSPSSASATEEIKTMSAADRIDKFYTFNKKNEEFQQLLNREYEKVKSGNAIKNEMSEAEELAKQKFEARTEDPSMEAFLEREGIVKPYQPKAFESDVLQRIEAQEAEKEAKRKEEEARLAAIEEARKAAAAEAEARRQAEEAAKKAAEEEAKRQAEEAARLRAEEEAKIAAEAEARRRAEEEAARLAEIAKRKAEEEARQAEEARIKAAEEAKRQAEEAERLRLEEEARQRAEAEAKIKAAEEARIKAEADLKAAQEAARIRARQEARLAAETEARFKAEQERKQLEAAEAQKRLEEERRKITREANQAVAQEEVRKVIEQTARMRDEEAAKIKATVAAMRDGIDQMRDSKVSREVEEAHQATKNQINEMARARDTFFAELEEAEPKASGAQPQSQDVHSEKAAERPVTGRETMLSNEEFVHTRTIDKASIKAGLNDDTIVASKKPNPAPESDDEFFDSLDKAAETNNMASGEEQTEQQPVQNDGKGAAVAGAALAGAAAGAVIGAGAATAYADGAQPTDAQPIDFKTGTAGESSAGEADDLLSQFESVNDLGGAAQQPQTQQPQQSQYTQEPEVQELQFQQDQPQTEQLGEIYQGTQQTGEFRMSDTIQAGNLSEAFKTEEKPGLNETLVMPKNEMSGSDAFRQAAAANDFDNYGNAEAANYREQQRQRSQNDMDDFYDDSFFDDEDESQLSKKELKKREKERKRLEKERAKEAKILAKRDSDFDNVASDDVDEGEKSGGKGRLALKIVLIVLIVILAAEVVGMGIRFLAPQSAAAEFIDNQLNKVIQLITGDDTEYSVIAAQVRAEPMEDKTDLIRSQRDRNVDDNIKEITYSSDLAYDQERDAEVSDLVLSQPMTQVEWGRDEDNYPVYYDEQVVGEIIDFESNLANLMRDGDEAVLGSIDPDSNLYTEISALSGQGMEGDFEKLEIGEIRQAGNHYYVWVRETIGGNSVERVYAMYPDHEFVMMMSARYEV